MISFILRKIWNNKWLFIGLLVGNVLLIGIVSSAPMYVQATLQRVLMVDFARQQAETGRHPATAVLEFPFNNAVEGNEHALYLESSNNILPHVINTLEVPVIHVKKRFSMENWGMMPLVQREQPPSNRSLSLAGYSGFHENINILHGRLPSPHLQEGNVIEAIANELVLMRSDILMNELLEVNNVYGDFFIQIVGIYEGIENPEGLLYWIQNPNRVTGTVLVDPDLIENYFIGDNYHRDHRVHATWYILLDNLEMEASRAAYYISADNYLKGRFAQRGGIWSYSENFMNTIHGFTTRVQQLSITIWVLQAPLYVLLAFYIFMVSKQIFIIEQNDISVLRSRGVSRGQILSIYTVQSLIMAVISLIFGIILGIYICRILGASSGFLDMVRRSALQVEVNAQAIQYSLIAAGLSVINMLLPVLNYSKFTIIGHKLKQSKVKKALWQRLFLDVLALGAGIYGLFTFHNQQELMAMVMPEARAIDPLLFISASLFILGLGLVCLRLFPYVISIIFFIGRKHWNHAFYASLINVKRSVGDEQFIMIFLIFTLAVGTFSAQTARTININNDELIMYTSGADLVFRERWLNNSSDIAAFHSAVAQGDAEGIAPRLVYQEPNINRFYHLDEVEAVARVFRDRVELRAIGAVIEDVRLMAIDTYEFGQTAWYRNDLLPVHINHFLNSLGSRADAVLLSENFRSRLDFDLGDRITITDSRGNNIQASVYGFVEHWPSFASVERSRTDAGEFVQQDVFFAVSNLGFIQTASGLYPYDVWLRTNTPTNHFFYDFINETGIQLLMFNDTLGIITDSRSDPILQGTNGVLTIGFIVTILICFTGFLIYWILSIRARKLQFSIFRAMGMFKGDIIKILVYEQGLITITAILIGAVAGEIAAGLFVPLIQISFAAADQVIPLRVVSVYQDYINLYGIMAVMIILCLFILGIFISKIKIAQSLKLGED